MRYADGAALDGYRFYFFSNEGHEPPHVHVDKGERSAKFWLDPVELAFNSGYNSKELAEISSKIAESRVALFEAWHEHFDHQV